MTTIRNGSQGSDVTLAQRILSWLGYSISVDGRFGPSTEKTVKDYQTKRGLKPDGIVGPATWEALTWDRYACIGKAYINAITASESVDEVAKLMGMIE